jgi:hypothetical protein
MYFYKLKLGNQNFLRKGQYFKTLIKILREIIHTLICMKSMNSLY